MYTLNSNVWIAINIQSMENTKKNPIGWKDQNHYLNWKKPGYKWVNCNYD